MSRVFSHGPQETPETANLATIGKYVVNVTDLGWPLEGQDAMSKLRFGHLLAQIFHVSCHLSCLSAPVNGSKVSGWTLFRRVVGRRLFLLVMTSWVFGLTWPDRFLLQKKKQTAQMMSHKLWKIARPAQRTVGFPDLASIKSWLTHICLQPC